MATNVKQFDRDVLMTLDVPKRQVIVLHRNFVATFVELVATDMPVDTGHARANILVSIDREDERENFEEPLDVGELVRRARSVMRHLSSFQEIFVNFNAPYTSFLNEGSSEQAPAGFIDSAAETANALFP